MKKLLLLLFGFSIIATGCTPMAYKAVTYSIDYSNYSADGFFITESNSVSFDYTPIASVGSEISSGNLRSNTTGRNKYTAATPEDAAMRSKTLEKAINASPTKVFYRGKFLKDAMKKEVLTHEEIYAEIRKYRMLNVDQVEAVVMELNGELTVIKKSQGAVNTSLKDINNDH